MLWVQQIQLVKVVDLIKILYSVYFIEDIDISVFENVLCIVVDNGIDCVVLEVVLGMFELKEQLCVVIEVVGKVGVFGLFFMIVDGELFWGFDCFIQLEVFFKNGKI